VSPRQRVDATLKHIDALTLRERVFVFAALLMLIGAAWEGLLNAPLTTRTEAARQQLTATAERLEQLDEAVAVAAAGLDGGVSDRLQVLRSLREAVAARERELRVFTGDLVDPAQMRLVVQELLRQQRGLQLVRTHNLPAAALLEPSENRDAEQSGESNLYLHGLVIELEGSYLELLAYLKSVEQLPWRIFFGRLDIESLDYPRMKIILELNTLSLEREWLGV
jgi:MSHA biogenesis protein MshJ